MDRREFVFRVGAVLVAVPAAAWLQACAMRSTAGNEAQRGETVSFTSTVVDGHSHRVILQRDVFESPPAGGVETDTTMDDGHVHRVSLTEEQLKSIAAGQTVAVETTVADGHLHTFTFELG